MVHQSLSPPHHATVYQIPEYKRMHLSLRNQSNWQSTELRPHTNGAQLNELTPMKLQYQFQLDQLVTVETKSICLPPTQLLNPLLRMRCNNELFKVWLYFTLSPLIDSKPLLKGRMCSLEVFPWIAHVYKFKVQYNVHVYKFKVQYVHVYWSHLIPCLCSSMQSLSKSMYTSPSQIYAHTYVTMTTSFALQTTV